MKKFLIIIFLFLPKSMLFGQCIDKINIDEDYTWTQLGYLSYCPLYVFSYNGDTSKLWNTNGYNIDFKQSPTDIKNLKIKVDKFINYYSGVAFFSKVVFEEVIVGYPDSLKKFTNMKQLEIENCKAKCVYFYRYKFDSISSFRFGVAIDNAGQIIQKLLFPSKAQFKPFDNDFDYCKLIDIAKKRKKDIEPIENIRLEYSTKNKKFNWRVTEKEKDPKLGIVYDYSVLIDAADMSKSTLIKSQTFREE